MMTNLSLIACWNNRSSALLMALAASGIGVTAVALASALKLEACHLCIFQRLVYFFIAAVFLIAFLLGIPPFCESPRLLSAIAPMEPLDDRRIGSSA